MRAHEAHAEGVAVSKGGKVFTIFSTSKDHNQGDKAMAGCTYFFFPSEFKIDFVFSIFQPFV